MNCIISNTSICGPRTKLGTNKNGWWKPKVNNNYGRLGFKFSSSHICSGCWFMFTKRIYQPQSNNLQTWGIWVSDVHRPTWIEFRGRLSKSALKRQHTGVLKDAAIALRLFAKENHCKNVGFTATNLFDGMKMVMCSIFVYTYIHTYIYIYIMCVYIGRQTYKHTIVYVHICIYAHITSHMIWFCLKMDWILRRPKKNEETSGEVNTMWFNGVLKFQTTPNEMTTRILITTQLTVHTEFHFYIHMCFVLYCNVLHGNLLLTRSVLRTKHVWRIQSKVASRRKTQPQHKYQIIRHVSRAEQFPKFCANVPGQFHHQT